MMTCWLVSMRAWWACAVDIRPFARSGQGWRFTMGGVPELSAPGALRSVRLNLSLPGRLRSVRVPDP